jgi:hypothetical protein
MQAVFDADDYDKAWERLESDLDIDLNIKEMGDDDFTIEEIEDAKV